MTCNQLKENLNSMAIQRKIRRVNPKRISWVDGLKLRMSAGNPIELVLVGRAGKEGNIRRCFLFSFTYQLPGSKCKVLWTGTLCDRWNRYTQYMYIKFPLPLTQFSTSTYIFLLHNSLFLLTTIVTAILEININPYLLDNRIYMLLGLYSINYIFI